jgi:hypothetical protein
VPSGKFTNQLLEARLGLEVLWVVSVTAIGVSPIDSETAQAIAFESTGAKVYLPSWEIWPIRRGTFVTRNETQWELLSMLHSPKRSRIDCFWASSIPRASGEEGQRAKPVLVGWTSIKAVPFEPSVARRREYIA